jgi:hypothetical protein
VRVLGEEPGLGLPNQHTKACPRFQTMHCWCPPATGPNPPHEKDCFQYTRASPSSITLQAQAYAMAVNCTCAAKSGVIGHASFCPLFCPLGKTPAKTPAVGFGNYVGDLRSETGFVLMPDTLAWKVKI